MFGKFAVFRETAASSAVSACLALALFPPAAGAVLPSAAVLSQVSGQVTLLPGPDAATGDPARPLHLVAPGAVLRLARGAEVVVICAGDRAVHLQGPTDWPAGADGCAAGRPLAAGTHARLVPTAGRVRDFHGSLLEEAPSRGEDGAGKVPTLLAPRGPQRHTVAVGRPAPEITWAEVHGALEYELVLERAGGEETVLLETAGLPCRPDPRSAPARACSVPWPWPPLSAGREARLRVRARTADPDWPRREADASQLRLPESATLTRVEARLGGIAATGLPTATLELLRADIYAEAELFNEAAAALAASLESRPQAAVAVRLANLYLGLGLSRAALAEYGRAESLLPPRITEDEEVRAAIELGLGRLYSRRQDPALAAHHLDRAASLYRRLGRGADAEAAEAEARLAKRHLR